MSEEKQDIPKFKSSLEFLDYLIGEFTEMIMTNKVKPKVGDVLKMIELRKKLSADSKTQEKFWELIDQLRQEELQDDA